MRNRIKMAFPALARTSLILVYLVILAGAVVRMTGSGMGCPDWPKCFGYLIPPTEEAELLWKPEKEYPEGAVIIVEERLLLSKEEFISGSQYNPQNWEPYTKHDYAEFNAAHTWIEYINRLLGALAGLSILLMLISSLFWWKEKSGRFVSSLIALVAIGFQGWLGATVVYSVLEPVKITLHMFMALVIVAILIYIVHQLKPQDPLRRNDTQTLRLWILTAILSLFQILMGTQVRQFVDEQSELLGAENKQLWLFEPEMIFYVHRSFSIIVLVLHLWVAYRIYSRNLGYPKIYPLLGILFMIIFTGVAMNYLDFPWGSQPIHLVMAALLFGLQWKLLLEMIQAARTRISL